MLPYRCTMLLCIVYTASKSNFSIMGSAIDISAIVTREEGGYTMQLV